MHRLYQTLKEPKDGENKFKRRITRLEKSDSTLPEIPNAVALIEYVGTYPGKGYHGLVKDKENNAPFVRTKPEVLQKLKVEPKHRTAKDVERQLNQETANDLDKHGNEKQLNNTKQYLAKKQQKSGTSNVADQIICVEEMT